LSFSGERKEKKKKEEIHQTNKCQIASCYHQSNSHLSRKATTDSRKTNKYNRNEKEEKLTVAVSK
jgi:hypothetical protein